MNIGAQMFTVNAHTGTLEGISESLKKIADIGYKSVQVSGTCAYEADWLKEELKKNGLTCNLTHISADKLINETQKVIDDHNTFDCKYIGVGIMAGINENNNIAHWTKFADTFKPVADKFAEAGKYFMYHNHHYEFVEDSGTIAMDYLCSAFAPDRMGFILDTHWVKAAGQDPIEWLRKLNGRIPCIHLKDLITMEDGSKRFAEVGKGEMEFEKILRACEDLDIEYAFVEQDNCYGEDPFKCLKTSFDYLHAQGLC